MRRCFLAIFITFFFVSAAGAIELPARKAGLWEIRMAHEDSQMPAHVVQHCVDAATDKLMQEQFGGQNICSKQEISRSGNTIVVESSCKIGNKVTATRAVFEGDFDSAYTAKVSTTLDGVERNMTMQAKWMGPCKPGQRPGDIEMPGGMKMNVLEMPKMPGTPQR